MIRTAALKLAETSLRMYAAEAPFEIGFSDCEEAEEMREAYRLLGCEAVAMERAENLLVRIPGNWSQKSKERATAGTS